MELLSQDIGTTIIWLTPPLSLILNIILLFALIYLLIKKTPRHHDEKSTDQRIASTYKEAEFEAAELMKDASEKAKRIIQDAGLTKETLESRLEKSLNDMSGNLKDKIVAREDEVFAAFKKVFDTIAQSYQNEGTGIVNKFKEEGETMLKTFIQTMHAEINAVRGEIFEKVDTKMQLIEEDLKKYREEQQKRLDQNIQKITKNTIELYMKDALGYENHQEILFKVLDRFKKDTGGTSKEDK